MSYYDVDFDRHPMPRSVVARIRERLGMDALRVDQPRVGFYKTRLVKDGPWCGVQLFWEWPTDPHTGEQLDRSPTMIALVNGEPRELFDTWVVSAKHPISETEYHELRAQAMNGLNVSQRLDLDQMKPIF